MVRDDKLLFRFFTSDLNFFSPTVCINTELTYGMLEMGGASTQIANFENDGDLMVSEDNYR